MAIKRRPRKRFQPDIVPLIDVIFFLLVFFIVFTTFRTTPTGLNIELPRAATAQNQAPTELTINVAADGTFYVSGERVTGQRIQSLVKQRLERNSDLFVIINADKQTRYDNVITAMDHVRTAGAYRIGLAVQPRDD
ncbi:MAG: biopolymer transporter ExbD [Firmicutes bacterium]|nr:biopolymer transporter ExbD [Bacillota bacterium]